MLYAFVYTSCIYESAAATVSLHRTKAGAWRAAYKARYAAWVEAREQFFKRGWYHQPSDFEWWGVCSIEVRD